LKDFLLFIFRI